MSVQNYNHNSHVYADIDTSASIYGSIISPNKWTVIGNDGIAVRQDANNQFMIRQVGDKINVSIKGLPTDTYNLKSGDIWRDGTTLRIIP
jgi:hypothetical protein